MRITLTDVFIIHSDTASPTTAMNICSEQPTIHSSTIIKVEIRLCAAERDKEELEPSGFTEITTFEEALDAIGYNESEQWIKKTIEGISLYSKATATMFQLNIIREALNKDYDLHLANNAKGEECIWIPTFKLVDTNHASYDRLRTCKFEKIGKIESEGVIYDVFGGNAESSLVGLGFFISHVGIGLADADAGFLGCATKEIARHFGLHFGMLIMQAMYGDMVDFKIVEE